MDAKGNSAYTMILIYMSHLNPFVLIWIKPCCSTTFIFVMVIAETKRIGSKGLIHLKKAFGVTLARLHACS